MKFGKKVFLISLIFMVGFAVGYARKVNSWQILINGNQTNLPVHVLKTGEGHSVRLFVSLEDLARLPGWNVLINLGSKQVSISTPVSESVSEKSSQTLSGLYQKTRHSSSFNTSSPVLEEKPDHSGPPDNVRLTVQAAVNAIQNVESELKEGDSYSRIEKNMKQTSGVVEQAVNLLWKNPQTRVLQADLQVAIENLHSQVELRSVEDLSQNGILPWTQPVARKLLLRYPDFRPCHETNGKSDGLSVSCAKEIFKDLISGDIHTIHRDLNEYEYR